MSDERAMLHYMVAADSVQGCLLTIGPFQTEREAFNAGRQWQRQHNGNLSWMTAMLPQGVCSVRFLQPGPAAPA